MKKLLVTTLTLTLMACGSDIDKKIASSEYSQTIKKIKENHPEFTEQDYNTASKELEKYAFEAMAKGNKELEITYADLLKEAQEKNAENKQKLDAYNKELQKLTDVAQIELLTGKFVDISDRSPMYPNGYVMDIKASNASSNTITLLKGKMLLLNQNDEQILSFTFDENLTLLPNDNLEGQEVAIIFDDDNLTELKALPINKIKQQWIPETIIFEDGTRMDAPEKPIL